MAPRSVTLYQLNYLLFISSCIYHIYVFSSILLSVVMKRVRFSRTKTVYVVDNYDRTSPSEILARDRVRFKRRIEMTEKLLSSILT